MNITTLGIDLAKNVFQLHGLDKKGVVILKQKINRNKLTQTIANIEACKIYMEACGSANFWGRRFSSLGHEVKLIHPKYVTPYVKRNKNDANDAAAISIAALAPGMRFIETKTIEQQDIQSIHRVRERLVVGRTGLVNQIRGLLIEYGIIIPQGRHHVRKNLLDIIDVENCELSGLMKDSLKDLYEELSILDKKIYQYDKKIELLYQNNSACKFLGSIPGIGKLGATILASTLGTGAAFKNGRHFAAFLGLVPKEHSSGGKHHLLGISKGGNTYIRKVLIHGARAVLRWSSKKTDPHSVWLKELEKRVGHNKALVAFANKMARMAWAVVHENEAYDANHKPKVNAVSLAMAL